MISKDFVYALEIVQKELSKFNIHWAVFGSVALHLHGLNIAPKELDIAVTMDQFGICHDVLLKHFAGKITEKDYARQFSAKIGNVQVEFTADLDGISSAVKQNLVQTMKIDGMDIDVIELEPLKQAYERMKRISYAKIIDDMLAIQEFKKTKKFPDNEFRKQTVLRYIIKDLETTRTYTGSELNSAISRHYGDFSLVKGELVSQGLLKKDSYKDLYWIDKHYVN